MEIIADTNFLVTCIKQKIDFFSQFDEFFGVGAYVLIVPQQVIEELNMLKDEKSISLKERQAAEVAIKILNVQEYSKKIKIINLKSKEADSGIIKYSNSSNSLVYIATLDKDLMKKIKNKNAKFLTIKQKKRINIVE